MITASVSNKSSRSNVTTTPASVIDAAVLVPRNIDPPPLRTLRDVRDQISQEIAINAITKAEYMDGKHVKISNTKFQ